MELTPLPNSHTLMKNRIFLVLMSVKTEKQLRIAKRYAELGFYRYPPQSFDSRHTRALFLIFRSCVPTHLRHLITMPWVQDVLQGGRSYAVIG